MPDQEPITRAADKAGVVGAIVAAMGCAACFPALGSLAAALGLGFLSQYEGVFIRYRASKQGRWARRFSVLSHVLRSAP